MLMWLNEEKIIDTRISVYKASLLKTCPNYVVIDDLFNESKLNNVLKALHNPGYWQTQKHTYSALYVNGTEWENASEDERFVKRDVWQRQAINNNSEHANDPIDNIAHKFLSFLRSDEFMSLLSRLFDVTLTDINVEEPKINTNYFRLSSSDFVAQHADDSPGREVCMLLYLNKQWQHNAGGDLVFKGDGEPIYIAPIFNRCVLFDPSSKGSEHWVQQVNPKYTSVFRYNVTSWYWSE